jgi:predicted kinase
MNPEAIILVGLQGAGKTTYYEQHFRETHDHVSRDIQGVREREIFRAGLAAKRSVVVDNTNATRALRAPYIRDAKAAGYRLVACYFDVPVRTAIGRNNHRQDKKPIPVPAILKTSKLIEPPDPAEDFDEIVVIR